MPPNDDEQTFLAEQEEKDKEAEVLAELMEEE